VNGEGSGTRRTTVSCPATEYEMSDTRHDPMPARLETGIPAGARVTPDRAARLSLLWVFALLNYLYCDVLGLFDVNTLKDLINGTGAIDMTQGFLLGSAILMEIPIAMVLLSVVLPYKASRWVNIAAGAIMTIVQVSSLFVGSGPTAYYLFFSAIEIATTAFIVWYAWTWHPVR
jgi:hypothetical protein